MQVILFLNALIEITTAISSLHISRKHALIQPKILYLITIFQNNRNPVLNSFFFRQSIFNQLGAQG